MTSGSSFVRIVDGYRLVVLLRWLTFGSLLDGDLLLLLVVDLRLVCARCVCARCVCARCVCARCVCARLWETSYALDVRLLVSVGDLLLFTLL